MAMSPNSGLASEDKPRCDAQVVVELVTRARDGDRQARDALVNRYVPLIWAICRRYRLDRADAEDVGQSVWLRLLEQLEKIRDRAALAGWLATTARQECIRVLHTRRPQPAGYVPDADDVPRLPDCRAGWVSLQAGARAGGPHALPLAAAAHARRLSAASGGAKGTESPAMRNHCVPLLLMIKAAWVKAHPSTKG
jgi:RNA polymerase sigma factor (sigma-70 family)